jgi:hypothetical protein
MNHLDARERLELAAAEPGGLDRLMAGDTVDGAAVAGHLAGCPECMDELFRLRRTATILREVVTAEMPLDLPADLRARTLAYVAELGVRRPLVVASASGAASTAVPEIGAIPRRRWPTPWMPWAASIAAAVVLSVVATTLVVGDHGADDAAALARVASWTSQVAAAPDARQVGLRPAGGGTSSGSLSFAATTGGLVVLATNLAPAPGGQEYRCWLETSAGRTRIGRMYFAHGIAYWVGDLSGLAALEPGVRFGVSLEDASGPAIGGPPVLLGTL